MFEVIYMKADFEPWWMFEGWEEHIEDRTAFTSFDEAVNYLQQTVQSMKAQYEFVEARKNCYIAFWTAAEQCFCEDCDDDLQTYHGLIFMKDGQPHPLDLKELVGIEQKETNF